MNFVDTHLENIFNWFIHKCVRPKPLKMSEVVPTLKSGDKHLTTNYRPISVISKIAKLFENLIDSRLLISLNESNITYLFS